MQINKRVTVTPSKYALWRCAIALAHCDGRLSNSETNLIHEFSENFDFSEAQMRQLEADFREKTVSPQEMFALIEDKLDRAHLINFARVLFHVDGDFSAVEEKLLEELHGQHMQTIDLRGALRSASESAVQYEAEFQAQIAQEKSKESWVMRAFRYLSGIDTPE